MADAADSKSAAREGVGVRVPPPAPSGTTLPSGSESATVRSRSAARWPPVRIEKLVYEGHGLGRMDGRVVFVDHVAAGDLVEIRLVRTCARHSWGELVRVVEPSPDRRTPPCPAAGRCGGCHWLHIASAAQLEAKTAILRDAIRPAGIAATAVAPIVGMDTPVFFRNKLSFSIGAGPNGGVCGFHERRAVDRVVTARDCVLQSTASQEIVRRIEARLGRTDPADWPSRATVREGKRTGDRMVVLTWRTAPRDAESWAREFSDLATAVVAIGGVAGAPRVVTGDGRLRERLGPFLLELGPADFFQTNTEQAERLMFWVRDRVAEAQPNCVAEFHAGTGAISLFLSGTAGVVRTVERHQPSVEAAQANARRNGVKNLRAVSGEAERLAKECLDGADVVVVDPPRAGLSPRFRRRLADGAARRLVYVSCNPATFARDARDLRDAGYEAVSVQPFDMFPHSYHVETAASFDRASSG